MKNYVLFIVLLVTSHVFSQNDPKSAFQRGKYELAVSYYKKADFVKAIDLFYLAAKLKPENEIGKESIKKVDSLREILRKNIITQVIGTWKKAGNQPLWASASASTMSQSEVDEIIEISENEIVFYELNKKTNQKKLLKTENLVYSDKCSASLYSEIVLSDGTIWNCTINDKLNVLHVINVAVQKDGGIEKITTNNQERFYIKI
ncbi:hypothetical protein [Flavobacterium hungaricum]|uniref:Tetratricopeptide repeat protein n=1 Tax=Flavobacterium hungaricum TaxID=2082725 RepID=A0ABR9TNG4_9FLAO|nr:hypothetical protein [Flavobacterium hungaricum]MBE8726905.1 hypothetical protein [Flavobacterium hungaricum]